jgi:hypothetical protein
MAQLVPGDRSMAVRAVAGTFGVLAVRTIYLLEIFILTICEKNPSYFHKLSTNPKDFLSLVPIDSKDALE